MATDRLCKSPKMGRSGCARSRAMAIVAADLGRDGSGGAGAGIPLGTTGSAIAFTSNRRRPRSAGPDRRTCATGAASEGCASPMWPFASARPRRRSVPAAGICDATAVGTGAGQSTGTSCVRAGALHALGSVTDAEGPRACVSTLKPAVVCRWSRPSCCLGSDPRSDPPSPDIAVRCAGRTEDSIGFPARTEFRAKLACAGASVRCAGRTEDSIGLPAKTEFCAAVACADTSGGAHAGRTADARGGSAATEFFATFACSDVPGGKGC